MFLDDLEIISESTYMSGTQSVVRLKERTKFYNAKRTGKDLIIDNGQAFHGSMMDFWRKKTGLTESDVFSKCSNKDCPYHGDQFRYTLQGAHIVLDRDDVNLKSGAFVYIVPLCPECNNPNNSGEMEFAHDVKAPLLKWTVHNKAKKK